MTGHDVHVVRNEGSIDLVTVVVSLVPAGFDRRIDADATVAGMERAFERVTEHWSPKVIGRVNDQYLKVAKVQGEFVWHQHDDEDELFLVVCGSFRVEFRDRVVALSAGEFVIVPRGIEHRTVADDEVHVLIFEPAATRNTGNVEHATLTAPIGDRV